VLEIYSAEPNTFFLKPLIALAEKQAPFVLHYFDAGELEQFAASFPSDSESSLQLEREGPLLIHDGTIISSSYFMLEYISEALPGPSLMPVGAYDGYRARAWGQYLGAQLGSIVPVLGCAKYLRPRLARQDADALARRIASIEPAERRAGWQALLDGACSNRYLDTVREHLKTPIARVEKSLGQEPWLAGPSFSIADIDAFAMLTVLPDLAPDVVNATATPRIIEYLARIGIRDSVRKALGVTRTGSPHEDFVPGAEASRWG
jgi:glutathione S-transferase